MERAYRKFGISYIATPQFKMFGNEVYTNRQAEARSLFPAFGYTRHNCRSLRFETLNGLLTTFANQIQLARIPAQLDTSLEEQIDLLLTVHLAEDDSLERRWNNLLNNYPYIFEVNIKAQKSIQKLRQLLGSDGDRLINSCVATPSRPFHFDGMIGNSLSIDDHSNFIPGLGTDNLAQEQAGSGFAALPIWKQKVLSSPIKIAQQSMMLRERARWASVRLVSHLRRSVEAEGRKHFPEYPELIYFATIQELLAGEVISGVCQRRQQIYEEFNSLEFPKSVASFPESSLDKQGVQGLSPGKVAGTLVVVSILKVTAGPKILYVKSLSPELTEYFTDVVGIVTLEGGLLSHLAIVARERGLPVVATNKKLTMGSLVEIDGTVGDIKFISGQL